MLQDGFDLGDKRVIHLEHLDRADGRFGEQRSSSRVRVDDVGLVQPAGPTLLRGAMRWDLVSIEPGDERDRDMRSPAR